MKFHERLKVIRTSAQKTQQQLADFLNVSPQSVSKWETGLSLPSIEYLPSMASFFGCLVETFFNDGILHVYEKYGPQSIRLFSFVSPTIFQDKERTDVLEGLLDARAIAGLYDFLCINEMVSISNLQRSLNLGYAAASKLSDTLHNIGIVDPENSVGHEGFGTIHKDKIKLLLA